MATPLLKKLGVEPGTRSILIQAPPEAVEAISLPSGEAATRLAGAFGFIHLFVTSEADLDKRFPQLKRHLQDGGKLWVSWPKGKGGGTDLTLQKVIAIGYEHGLVESRTLSLDPIWSAIKFTFPKPERRTTTAMESWARGAGRGDRRGFGGHLVRPHAERQLRGRRAASRPWLDCQATAQRRIMTSTPGGERMRRRVAVVSAALLLILSLSAPAPSAAYCEFCNQFCPPPWYICEYACEIVTGFCPNCFHYCVAGGDFCRQMTPCYWVQVSPEDPAAALLAEITLPEPGPWFAR